MDTDIVRNILMCTYSEMVSYSYALNEISTIKIAKNLQKAQVTVYLPKIKKKQSEKESRVLLLHGKLLELLKMS